MFILKITAIRLIEVVASVPKEPGEMKVEGGQADRQTLYFNTEFLQFKQRRKEEEILKKVMVELSFDIS